MGVLRRGRAAPRERSRLYAADPLTTITGPANDAATPEGEGSHRASTSACPTQRVSVGQALVEERPRNDARSSVGWRFTVTDARRKLRRLYPA